MSKKDNPDVAEVEETDVLFDLGNLDAEPRRKVRPKPFTFSLDSHVYDEDGVDTGKIRKVVITLADPEELEWDVVAGWNDAMDFRSFFDDVILDDAQLDAFHDAHLKTADVQRLIERYMRHYGLLDSRGNRRAGGSRRR